ncbi:MAG TPA: iron-containing redox enzyme family protein [Acidimicrobiales bacterium]|nr:iron-containing redox enzyme family protein [Acidimicrobiales bacterium]
MSQNHVVIAPRATSTHTPCARELDRALASGDFSRVEHLGPADATDAVVTLLAIYDLWLGSLPSVDGRERYQNHPVVASLKWRLEADFVNRLEELVPPETVETFDAVSALRRIARRDDAPIYDWLATSATWSQLVKFLAIEGGPDGGFDDLVAICQVGLDGAPKVVLGANYWDEMGRGELADVHTELHRQLVRAVDLPRLDWSELPSSALERSALNGLLATNRWLQPEMIGALGLLELQAGPRCRRVLRALRRLEAPSAALPFYDEHADTDPRHGKEWLDGAVAPLVEAHPEWHARIVRGARWRAELNSRLFADALKALQDVHAESA